MDDEEASAERLDVSKTDVLSPYQSSIIAEKPDCRVLKLLLFRRIVSASSDDEVDDDDESSEETSTSSL